MQKNMSRMTIRVLGITLRPSICIGRSFTLFLNCSELWFRLVFRKAQNWMAAWSIIMEATQAIINGHRLLGHHISFSRDAVWQKCYICSGSCRDVALLSALYENALLRIASCHRECMNNSMINISQRLPRDIIKGLVMICYGRISIGIRSFKMIEDLLCYACREPGEQIIIEHNNIGCASLHVACAAPFLAEVSRIKSIQCYKAYLLPLGDVRGIIAGFLWALIEPAETYRMMFWAWFFCAKKGMVAYIW